MPAEWPRSIHWGGRQIPRPAVADFLSCPGHCPECSRRGQRLRTWMQCGFLKARWSSANNTLGLLRSLASVYLRLGPRVFRHLNFNCRVAWPYRERVGVEGVRSEAAHAVTTDPSAIGNK